MAYSLIPILLDYKDKDNKQKVSIQLIFNRIKIYIPTGVKVSAASWQDGKVIKEKNKTELNNVIAEVKHIAEKKILEAMRDKQVLTKQELQELIKNKKVKASSLITSFIYDYCDQHRHRLSEGRIKHFKVVAGKLEVFSPSATFDVVTVDWIISFEAFIRSRGVDGNTLQANMNIFKNLLYRAAEKGLVDKGKFDKYAVPKYIQKIPEYLTEPEIDKIKNFVDIIEKPGHKLAGYYFLLSCLTGYRISDAKRFDYNEMVREGKVILRATKNKQIVSIPLYPKLEEVINFVKDKPLNLSEQKVREYVKDICSFIGIKKHIKFHASRHSFAVMLINRGFSIDEVAQLIGDSKDVAQIYARITNKHLEQRFNTLMH